MSLKKRSLLLFSASLLVSTLASCGFEPASGSSSNPPEVEESSSSFTPVAFATLEEARSAAESTIYKGFTFEEKGDKKASGTLTFNDEELWVSGKATFEEEGTINMVIYKGKKNGYFLDVENYVGKHAKKKKIVESVTDSKTEIAEASLKEELASPYYNANWFADSLASLFDHASSFSSKIQGDEIEVEISSYLGGTNVMGGTLRFDGATHSLLKGTLEENQWEEENFDETTKAPIDKDQKPKKSSSRSAELLLGDPEATSFDPTPYFVSSISDVSLSSYSDYASHPFEAEAGEYISLRFDSYSPSTAFNDGDIKIVSSSNPEVISLDEFTGSAKAVKAGKSTLKVSDPLGEVTFEAEVTVTSPSIKALYLYADSASLKPDQEASLRVEFYPEASADAIQAVSSDPSVVQVVSVAEDRKSVQVKALKEGTAKITISSGSVTSKAVTLTVKEPKPEADSSFIVGKWHYSSASYDATFTFNADKTGDVLLVIDDGMENKATFSWSYDGNSLAFSNWKTSADGYVDKIASVSLETNATSFSASLTFDDEDGYDSTRKMTFTKQKEDVSWLVGTWKPEDENVPVLVLNADGSGTYRQSLYGGTYQLTWTYVGGVLSFPKEGWKNSMCEVKSVTKATKDGITLKMEDDEGTYSVSLVKQA